MDTSCSRKELGSRSYLVRAVGQVRYVYIDRVFPSGKVNIKTGATHLVSNDTVETVKQLNICRY